MKRLLTAMLVAVMAIAHLSFGQCDDPYDATLCVYTLTSDQESGWNATDAAVSPFWAEITGDQLNLAPPDDCAADACNFTGADDGSMVVKAAGTGKGIYLYCEVSDNTWVDWSGGDSYGDDSVDLYFDAMDANSIFTCTDCLIGLYSSTLTYTTQQFQVFMGASSLPDQFRMAYYDENLWSWQTVTITWAAAASLYGFEAEIVEVNATTKAQEWFFPWEKFGGGLAVGSSIAGTRVGFCGGYNDMDGDNTAPDKLRWPEAGDPWAGDAQTLNYWGDFLIADDMPDVEAVVSVDRPQVQKSQGPAAGTAASVQYFTLAGEQIARSMVDAGRTAGVVVERTTLTDGRVVSRRLGEHR